MIMESIHQEVWHFFRTQAWKLIGLTLPVVVVISLWLSYLTYAGWDNWTYVQGWLDYIKMHPGDLAHAPAFHVNLAETMPSLIAQLLFDVLAVLGIDRLVRGTEQSTLKLWQLALERGPRLFVAQLLSGLLVILGLMAFLIPGAYLSGRYLLVSVEAPLSDKSPLQSMADSWSHTQGRAWVLLGGYMLWSVVRGLGTLAVSGLGYAMSEHSVGGMLMMTLTHAVNMWLGIPVLIYLYRARLTALSAG
ncbi:MAG: hypothetical protein HKM02_06965 [Pseudomonadales bacterium]|nr:hypothetical protein [Pseudomonadales bacterium]